MAGVRAIAGRIQTAASRISTAVLSITDWIGEQLHVSSRFASRAGFVVLWGVGMTLIEVDEYALAMLAWILSSIVLFSKAVHWQGIVHRPRITTWLRIICIVSALSFIPVSVVWTQAKRGDKPWTVFMAPHSQPQSTVSDSSKASDIAGAVKKLRTDYRDALNTSGTPNFSRAKDDLALLKQLGINSGLVWYYSGEIKRLSNPSLFTIGSCPKPWSSPPDLDLYHFDFYRYLDGATRYPGMTDPGLEVCYENSKGYCLQWTTWIYHLMANDFYRDALVDSNEFEQRAKFEKAYDFAVKATQYHPPEGGEGFDQCVNTKALIQILRDKLDRQK